MNPQKKAKRNLLNLRGAHATAVAELAALPPEIEWLTMALAGVEEDRRVLHSVVDRVTGERDRYHQRASKAEREIEEAQQEIKKLRADCAFGMEETSGFVLEVSRIAHRFGLGEGANAPYSADFMAALRRVETMCVAQAAQIKTHKAFRRKLQELRDENDKLREEGLPELRKALAKIKSLERALYGSTSDEARADTKAARLAKP